MPFQWWLGLPSSGVWSRIPKCQSGSMVRLRGGIFRTRSKLLWVLSWEYQTPIPMIELSTLDLLEGNPYIEHLWLDIVLRSSTFGGSEREQSLMPVSVREMSIGIEGFWRRTKATSMRS